MTGELFAGRYDLIERLGSGGMGEVWRAHDRKRDRVVAVKVLQHTEGSSLMRFMREQGVRIQHPHVLTPLAWAGDDDRVLYSMPLVRGGTVSTLIGDYGPLPPRYVAELLRQLFSGLEAVHRARIIHRDVKTENLMLDARGTAKPHLWLTDFGLAIGEGDARLTRADMVMGTPGYISPEALAGALPSPAQDLYAVGIVAYECLTGARRDPEMPLPPPSTLVERGVPRELAHLVGRLTDRDVGLRPGSPRKAAAWLDTPALAWEDQDTIEVFDQLA